MEECFEGIPFLHSQLGQKVVLAETIKHICDFNYDQNLEKLAVETQQMNKCYEFTAPGPKSWYWSTKEVLSSVFQMI